MKGFVGDLQLGDFVHLADLSGELWRALEISAQPSFVFINDDGQLTRHIGSLTEDELVAELDRLVAE